jgi:5-methylcytosine-specific restriction endonuclease McrA
MDLKSLSGETLLAKLEALAAAERAGLAEFLAHLGAVELRWVCQARGYSSVFAYLTRQLGYAESDAARRVRVARAAQKYPELPRMLAAGEMHLLGLSMLELVLTPDNQEGLLRKAARLGTRELSHLIAGVSPAAAEPRDSVRVLPPAPAAAPEPNGAGAPGKEPLSAEVPTPRPPERLMFTFAAGDEVQSWLEEARDLLRHRFPSGRMEELVGEALRRLVEAERPDKPGRERTTDRPPAETSLYGRYIPKWVRDAVWRRDSGRCAFKAPDGTRCGETAWLEWDHVIPWGLGGRSNDPSNIRLLCRAHNQSEARRIFGPSAYPGPVGLRPQGVAQDLQEKQGADQGHHGLDDVRAFAQAQVRAQPVAGQAGSGHGQAQADVQAPGP